MTEADERRCPWGHDEHLADGTRRHRRVVSNYAGVVGGRYEEPCAFCGGTNRYADWMQHPEYARQVTAGLRVDER